MVGKGPAARAQDELGQLVVRRALEHEARVHVEVLEPVDDRVEAAPCAPTAPREGRARQRLSL